MANIIITEEQEAVLMNALLMNSNPVEDLSDKVLSIKKYLDKYFQRGDIDQIKDGKPDKLQVVVMKADNGKILKTLTDKQLFDQVQTDFRNILPEKDRDAFIKDVIIHWYNNKISDSGVMKT